MEHITCRGGKLSKRFLSNGIGVVLFTFVISLLLLAKCSYPDALYKSWDSHFIAIEKAMNTTIPSSFIPKDKPVMIESLPDKEVERAIKHIYNDDIKARNYHGFYFPREQKQFLPNMPKNGSLIILVGHSSADVEEYVVTHEYGHHVYFEMLTDSERQWWDKEWNKENNSRTLPTNYSYYNEYEGFAEAFAGYVHHNKNVSKDDVKFIDGIGKRLDRKYRGLTTPQIDSISPSQAHTIEKGFPGTNMHPCKVSDHTEAVYTGFSK